MKASGSTPKMNESSMSLQWRARFSSAVATFFRFANRELLLDPGGGLGGVSLEAELTWLGIVVGTDIGQTYRARTWTENIYCCLRQCPR